MKVTDQIWPLILSSSDSNGDDFGFVEDIVEWGATQHNLSPQQVGGALTQLQKLGKISIYEPVTTDSGTWTQFVIVQANHGE
ncbi:hypothetical protein N9955_00520 [bacterium]|nr:hypothetical protein [bacterium]